MKRRFCGILCLLIVSLPAMASDTDVAKELIKSKLDAVLLVLQNKDLNNKEKNSRIIEIVTPIFDFQRMAKLTLGRKYWPRLRKEEQERFTELFVKRLKESYGDRFALYTDEKITYEEPVQIKNKVHIPTVLVSKDSKIVMLYKLYKPKNKWRIYDIEIQGVSLIQTYRSQFIQILQSGTVDDLLLKLQQEAVEG